MTFVKQELSYTQRAWYLRPVWLIFFAWVYGTSQNLPVFHSADVIPIEYNNSTIYYCTTTQGHSFSRRIYLGFSVLLGFVIPLATMTVSYYRVIKVVWTRNRRISSSADPESKATITNEKLLERSRKSVLRVLLIVVICFVICWLPFALYHGILEQYLKEYPNPMDAVRLITYGLGLANSMCNPFIYYFNVGGKSFSSMKKKFIEVMGGRVRTLTIPQRSFERNSPLPRPGCNYPTEGDMMELDLQPSHNARYNDSTRTCTSNDHSHRNTFSINLQSSKACSQDNTKL